MQQKPKNKCKKYTKNYDNCRIKKMPAGIH